MTPRQSWIFPRKQNCANKTCSAGNKPAVRSLAINKGVILNQFEHCHVAHEGRICIITINRPSVMNALHRPANLELQQAFDDFESNPDLWVAILTGAGDQAFCAGNDLKIGKASCRERVSPDVKIS